MKRLVAFVLMLVMLLSLCYTSVLAEGENVTEATTENTSYEWLGATAVTLTCEYSDDANKIEVNGNVNYNVLVSYGKYTLGILRISPIQSTEDAINAQEPDIAASMNIAAKFSFSIGIKNTVERFSKYAVVIISPEGEIILASEPRNISVSSSTNTTKENFKGILPVGTEEISISGDMGFGSVIIPVYYDRLVNLSMNGYIYPHEDTHCFFDRSYIDELDAQVRTYSVRGAKVYFQLLLPFDRQNNELMGFGGEESCYYELPDVYDSDTLSKIYTYVKFLTSRYNSDVDGKIGGIIVGDKIDKNEYNACGGLSVDDYAERYAFYLSVVANTARVENPNIDIIVPFSSVDCYGKTADINGADYLPTELIEKISSILDGCFYDGFHYNIMVESGDSPVGIISSEDGSDDIYTVQTDNSSELSVNDLKGLNSFLSGVKKRYRSSPDNYIFLWQIPTEIKGNLLECSYVYSYYTLFRSPYVSSFVISFSQADEGALEEIMKTVRVIDTAQGKQQCNSLLHFFKANSWKDIIDSYSESGLILRDEFVSGNGDISSSSKGRFSYFNFSTGDTSGWYGASFGKSVNSDYGEGGQRVLRQTVERATGAAHSDLIYIYEYDESLAYTPSLNFKMAITDGEVSSGDIYEVTVTIGKGSNSITRSQTVLSGAAFDMWLDVESYGKTNNASYIKISTRSITGSTDEYSLWVYDVSGHSSIYSSQELNELISEERRNIRDQQQNADGNNDDSIIYWIVFAIILFAILIGGVLLITLRRDDSRKNNKRTEQ